MRSRSPLRGEVSRRTVAARSGGRRSSPDPRASERSSAGRAIAWMSANVGAMPTMKGSSCNHRSRTRTVSSAAWSERETSYDPAPLRWRLYGRRPRRAVSRVGRRRGQEAMAMGHVARSTQRGEKAVDGRGVEGAAQEGGPIHAGKPRIERAAKELVPVRDGEDVRGHRPTKLTPAGTRRSPRSSRRTWAKTTSPATC